MSLTSGLNSAILSKPAAIAVGGSGQLLQHNTLNEIIAADFEKAFEIDVSGAVRIRGVDDTTWTTRTTTRKQTKDMMM